MLKCVGVLVLVKGVQLDSSRDLSCKDRRVSDSGLWYEVSIFETEGGSH